MAEWSALEALVDTAIIGSPLAESVTYTPTGESPLAIRAVFDVSGAVIEMESGLRVSTGMPMLAVRDSDIGRAAVPDDAVTVGGVGYVVVSVRPGGRGWSHCDLHSA